MIYCRLCHTRITFDDYHVSGRAGRKIPLDFDTEEPHDCPMWESNNRTYKECNKRCGHEIFFDKNVRTVNGKWIPIDKDILEPHNCPNADYDDVEDDEDGEEDEEQ